MYPVASSLCFNSVISVRIGKGISSGHVIRRYRTLLSVKLPKLQNAKLTVASTDAVDPVLRRVNVKFSTSTGEEIAVDAVFQDTSPSGSQLGAVVAIHGAPGSHRDYKYIAPLLHEKGIRFIGVNMPGFGLTPGDPRLLCDNTERDNFVHELIARIGNVERLVVLAHSRGTENGVCVAAKNLDKLAALVLLNPTGLRLHRALRPFCIVEFVLWLYSSGSIAKNIMDPFLKFLYNNVLGLRLDSGERAAMCIRTMSTLEYAKFLRPHIERINGCKNARVLVAYAGKDHLIETSISREFANSFIGLRELICHDKEQSSEERAIQETRELFSSGVKSVSIYFKRNGHFLQRDRARYTADAIEAILRSH